MYPQDQKRNRCSECQSDGEDRMNDQVQNKKRVRDHRTKKSLNSSIFFSSHITHYPRAQRKHQSIMSDEEHHFEPAADAGASKTYPQQAGTIRKNGYIVIKSRPCKVFCFSLSPSRFVFFEFLIRLIWNLTLIVIYAIV